MKGNNIVKVKRIVQVILQYLSWAMPRRLAMWICEVVTASSSGRRPIDEDPSIVEPSFWAILGRLARTRTTQGCLNDKIKSRLFVLCVSVPHNYSSHIKSKPEMEDKPNLTIIVANINLSRCQLAWDGGYL